MPCGGITPCAPITSDDTAWCHQCGETGTLSNPLDHFVLEWDNYLHRRCIPEFLLTMEGQITWINHGHEVIISEVPGVKNDPIVPTMCTKLATALHGSRLVLFEEEKNLIFTWNGFHTVNVLTATGESVDVLTVGNVTKPHATLEEVNQTIENYT